MTISSTPTIKRRLASMLYESMLLFGVLFISGWLFSTLLQQRHALYLRHGLQVWLFLIMGLYFVWFWTHGGQTLAMKTWRLRLAAHDGTAPGLARALLRYLLGWLWILPGVVLVWALDLKGWPMALLPAANILLWSLTAFLDPQRQFLHDRIAGTRILRIAELPAVSSPATQGT